MIEVEIVDQPLADVQAAAKFGEGDLVFDLPKWRGGASRERAELEAVIGLVLEAARQSGADSLAIGPLGVAEGFPPVQAAGALMHQLRGYTAQHDQPAKIFIAVEDEAAAKPFHATLTQVLRRRR